MNSNPFASETFIRIWSKHFNNSNIPKKFDFINHVKCVEHSKLPLFYNAGNKLTNGNFYDIYKNENDFKNKTFLIRDIPSYHGLQPKNYSALKIKTIFQYQGYTTKINDYDSLDNYLKHIYKSNTRSKLRRNVNRLEACFDVEYVMFNGDISDDTFHSVFDNFYKLFERRYTDKGEPCGELDPKIWSYYTELGLALIREKKASLFVIYCDKKPAGITFSYHVEQILIEALTVFDIDFYRFNIGHTMILKMLQWSFENNIQLFDYTQGDFEYKKRWSDSTYKTHYHVLYDSKSVKSILMANFLQGYFNGKRKFRELKLNKIYHNFVHKLYRDRKTINTSISNFNIEVVESQVIDLNSMVLVDINGDNCNSIRRSLYDYLYGKPELVKNIKIYKVNDNVYYVQGQKNLLKIVRDAK